jgi:hypothetical protein
MQVDFYNKFDNNFLNYNPSSLIKSKRDSLSLLLCYIFMSSLTLSTIL